MNSKIISDNKVLEIFSDELRNNKKGLFKKNSKNKDDFPTLILSRIEESIEFSNNKNKNKKPNRRSVRLNDKLIDTYNHILIAEEDQKESAQQKLKNLQKSIIGLNIDNNNNHTILKLNKGPNKLKIEQYYIPENFNNLNSDNNINDNNLPLSRNDSSDLKSSKLSINSFYSDFLRKIKQEHDDDPKQKYKNPKKKNSSIISSPQKFNQIPNKIEKTSIVNENILANILKQCDNNESNKKIRKISEKNIESESTTRNDQKNYTRRQSQFKIKNFPKKTIEKLPSKKYKKEETNIQEENEKKINNNNEFNEGKNIKDKKHYKKNMRYSLGSLDSKDMKTGIENGNIKKNRKKSKIFQSVIYKSPTKIFKDEDSVLNDNGNRIVKNYSIKHNKRKSNFINNKINISNHESSNDFIETRNHLNIPKKQKNKNLDKNSVDYDEQNNSVFYSNLSFETNNDKNNSPRKKKRKSTKCRSIIQNTENYDKNNWEYNSNNNKINQKIYDKSHFSKYEKSNSKHRMKIENYNNDIKRVKSRKNSGSVHHSSKGSRKFVKYKIRNVSHFNIFHSNKKQNNIITNGNNFSITPIKSVKMSNIQLIKPESLIAFEYNKCKKSNENKEKEQNEKNIKIKESNKEINETKDNKEKINNTVKNSGIQYTETNNIGENKSFVGADNTVKEKEKEKSKNKKKKFFCCL